MLPLSVVISQALAQVDQEAFERGQRVGQGIGRLVGCFCCCPSVPLLAAFWIWMLIEVITKEPAEAPNTTGWTLTVALAGPVGAAIYFFARRSERKRQYGK